MVKEDIVVPEDCVLLPRLKNSDTLQNLDAMFSHLTVVQNKDLTQGVSWLVLRYTHSYSSDTA